MNYKKEPDALSVLQIQYEHFTVLEKSIADFFLKNKEAMDFSSKNIAGMLYISESSLSRFAQKCGFKGYREFVYWYQKQFQRKEDDRLEDRNEMILDTYQELLKKSYALINEEQIRRVAKFISEKKNIFIYGKGFSGVAAKELQLRLICIGIHAHYITDSYLMAMNSALITSDSLVIGISVSGETKEIFYSLEKSKIQGAGTVAISSIHMKQWDTYCDEVLLIPTKENLTLGKLISPQFPILILFDVLYSNILRYDQKLKTGFPEFIRAELNAIAPTFE